MTTEQPLPMLAQNAQARAFRYAREAPCTAEDREDVVLAAHTLALVIDRVRALMPSQIGADEYLSQFDGGDYDSISFYRGIVFALSTVNATLFPSDRSR